MASDRVVEARELGIPVRAVFHCILYPGGNAAGPGALLAVMGQHAGGFLVLDIDPATGATRQYECRYPHAFLPEGHPVHVRAHREQPQSPAGNRSSVSATWPPRSF